MFSLIMGKFSIFAEETVLIFSSYKDSLIVFAWYSYPELLQHHFFYIHLFKY